MLNSESCKAYEGEWALIVGASVGLGKAWAMECAKRGFNVIVCARSLGKLQDVTKEIREQYQVSTKEFVCDISESKALDVISDAIEGLDIGMMIYNAAIETGGYFIKVDEKYHRQQLIGNAEIPTLLSHKICRNMARKHRGYVLLISSMAGTIGTANQASYGGCKAHMAILGESLWYEMRKYGVYAATVTVGAIATPNFIAQQQQQMEGIKDAKTPSFTDLGIDASVLESLEKENKDKKSNAPKGITPEEAAAYVMEHVGEGPRLFTSAADETAYYGIMQMKRETGVSLMSTVTDMYFSNFSEFNTEDVDTFTEIEITEGNEIKEAKYNLDTPLNVLFKNKEARTVIAKELPKMDNPMLRMLPMNLRQLAEQSKGELTEEQLLKIEAELEKIG